MPQPYLVPVRPSCSRNTHSSGVSGSALCWRARPLTFRVAIDLLLLCVAIGPDGGRAVCQMALTLVGTAERAPDRCQDQVGAFIARTMGSTVARLSSPGAPSKDDVWSVLNRGSRVTRTRTLLQARLTSAIRTSTA